VVVDGFRYRRMAIILRLAGNQVSSPGLTSMISNNKYSENYTIDVTT
jgi:hypothetical protein